MIDDKYSEIRIVAVTEAESNIDSGCKDCRANNSSSCSNCRNNSSHNSSNNSSNDSSNISSNYGGGSLISRSINCIRDNSSCDNGGIEDLTKSGITGTETGERDTGERETVETGERNTGESETCERETGEATISVVEVQDSITDDDDPSNYLLACLNFHENEDENLISNKKAINFINPENSGKDYSKFLNKKMTMEEKKIEKNVRIRQKRAEYSLKIKKRNCEVWLLMSEEERDQQKKERINRIENTEKVIVAVFISFIFILFCCSVVFVLFFSFFLFVGVLVVFGFVIVVV